MWALVTRGAGPQTAAADGMGQANPGAVFRTGR